MSSNVYNSHSMVSSGGCLVSVQTCEEILVFEVPWDEEAEVWYTSETPIQGALAEAPTLTVGLYFHSS